VGGIKKIAEKALETGVNTALPLASRAVTKVADSPAGPVIGKAAGAGVKVGSTVIGLLKGGARTITDGTADVVEQAADKVEGLADRVESDSGSQAAQTNRSGAPAVAPAHAPVVELPMPTYKHLSLPAILDGLNGLTVRELRIIRSHEMEHENRLPIIDRVDELLASVDAAP
jgi:hypothetical protein